MRIVVRGRRIRRKTQRPDAAREFDRAVAEFFMRLALSEAQKGVGRTRPNPAVGAVLVKNGRIVARGFHAKAGGPHAEIVALRRAGERARGADLYVTLEPCDHHGRTPPCTAAVLAAGIRRVFVGCEDANPIVSGRGIRALRRAGIPVVTGVLEQECAEINRPFFTFITKRRPFVTLKIAATADGKIATATGDSRWVSGEKARHRVHRLRDRVDAILVGAQTVRQDDPQLTARLRGRPGSFQPLRVILSASLEISPRARIFEEPKGGVLILTTSRDARRISKLEARGAQVVRVPGRGRRLDVGVVLAELYRRDIVHLLVEGGAEVFAGFLDRGVADEVMLFVAPKILGDGVGWAPLPAKAKMNEAIALSQTTVEQVGEDVLIIGRPLPKP